MSTSLDFIMGFILCATVIFLYLLYQFIELLRELIMILREELKSLLE